LTTKVCSACSEEKNLGEFYKRTNDKLHASCKDCQKAHKKKYYQKHKERIKESRKRYYTENKVKVRRAEARYRKKRNKVDPQFKLIQRVRNHVYQYLMLDKKFSTMTYLGCTAEELKVHLEKQFKPGMSWENYGTTGWHIDHIFPLSKANLKDEEQVEKVFHFTNLQPLWAHDNLSKGNKL
jgi:hypothetical protein